jgi:hypothetical protein
MFPRRSITRKLSLESFVNSTKYLREFENDCLEIVPPSNDASEKSRQLWLDRVRAFKAKHKGIIYASMEQHKSLEDITSYHLGLFRSYIITFERLLRCEATAWDILPNAIFFARVNGFSYILSFLYRVSRRIPLFRAKWLKTATGAEDDIFPLWDTERKFFRKE